MSTNGLPYRACVGVMVLNPRGYVWIGRRNDVPHAPEGPGTWWQMPQGGIDTDEAPRTAALRELREETGIRSNVEFLAELPDWVYYDLPPELQSKTWGGRYRGQKQKWFALRFTGSDAEISIIPAAGEKAEFDAWRWAPLDELLDLIVPFKRSVYETVVREFAPIAVPIGR